MTDEITLDAPETRLERFLAAAAGMDGITLDEPVTRIEKYLYNIAQNSGGALPPITAADNGKVLTANSGVWGAENEVFYFDVAYNLSDGSYTAQSVNREELVDAINKGKRFAMRYTDGNRLTTIIDVQSFGKSATNKSEHALFIGEATISDDSDTGFTTINLIASVSPDEDPSITETSVAALILNHDNRFIVTLTPTAADFSGTMDKTVAEIDAAYKAGRKVVFRVMTGATTYREVDCATRVDVGETYPSYSGYLIDNVNNVLIVAYTGASNDGTEATYGTYIYTLTLAT